MDVPGWIFKAIECWQRRKEEQKQKFARTPKLQLHVGSSGGPSGWSYNVIISNQGDETAYDICVDLPGINKPACKLKNLTSQKQSDCYLILLSDNSPFRKEPHSELRAHLHYKNKYDERFTFEYALRQTKRADSLYNIELDESKEPILKPQASFQRNKRLDG